VDSDWSA